MYLIEGLPVDYSESSFNKTLQLNNSSGKNPNLFLSPLISGS